MYQPFRQPVFVNKKMPDVSTLKHPKSEKIKFPEFNAPWFNHDNQNYPLFEIFNLIKNENLFPEYIWGHYGDGLEME